MRISYPVVISTSTTNAPIATVYVDDPIPDDAHVIRIGSEIFAIRRAMAEGARPTRCSYCHAKTIKINGCCTRCGGPE